MRHYLRPLFRLALLAIAISFRLPPCCAQGEGIPAPAATRDTIELSTQLETWLDEYAKAKKPSAELQAKIDGLRGKSITVSGLLKSTDGPLVVSVGAPDSRDKVDYILQADFPKAYRGENEVGVRCTGVIIYIDRAKKIVILDHASAVWTGTN